jgi:DNA modification methylase
MAEEVDDHRLFNCNFIELLRHKGRFFENHLITCTFADPPDNLGLAYHSYRDNLSEKEYEITLEEWVKWIVGTSRISWISFNTKWIACMGTIVKMWMKGYYELKPCVQTFTFGQNRQDDLSNCHRPLWRFRYPGAPLYPDQIRIESWRQQHGDKRANPHGKVPGDVFDFPRVTGNSKQRRPWHPTQLHEGLVERCIKLSTKEGECVFDPFAGTGTVTRVCKRINRKSLACELDPFYCEMISDENKIKVELL